MSGIYLAYKVALLHHIVSKYPSHPFTIQHHPSLLQFENLTNCRKAYSMRPNVSLITIAWIALFATLSEGLIERFIKYISKPKFYTLIIDSPLHTKDENFFILKTPKGEKVTKVIVYNSKCDSHMDQIVEATESNDRRRQINVNRKTIEDALQTQNTTIKTHQTLCFRLTASDKIVFEFDKNWHDIRNHYGIEVMNTTFYLKILPDDDVEKRVEFYRGNCIEGLQMAEHQNSSLLPTQLHPTPEPEEIDPINGSNVLFSVEKATIEKVLENPSPTTHICIQVIRDDDDHILARVSKDWSKIRGLRRLTLNVLEIQKAERERREKEAKGIKDAEQKTLASLIVKEIVNDKIFANKLEDVSKESFAKIEEIYRALKEMITSLGGADGGLVQKLDNSLQASKSCVEKFEEDKTQKETENATVNEKVETLGQEYCSHTVCSDHTKEVFKVEKTPVKNGNLVGEAQKLH